MEKSIRQSNFELLRIVCMMMIVILHTLGHGGAYTEIKVESSNMIVVHIMESLSIVAVNCYILISGYFGINSKFNLKKLYSLYWKMLFYSITISILFWGIGYVKIDLNEIVKMIFPLTMQNWWFMSIFLILYIISPYLNKLLKNISFKEYNLLLIILLLIFSIWPSIPLLNPIDNKAGYSLYHFVVLYIIGAYIRIFYESKEINKYFSMSIYISISILLSVINIFISKIVGKISGMYSYNFILIIISSISLFLFFKEVNIQNNLINKIASFTLGVYLIHDHEYVRQKIYTVLGYNNYLTSNKFFIYTLITVVVIYITSLIIEFIREYMFSYIVKCKVLKHIYNKFTNIIIRVNYFKLYSK